MYNLYTGFHSDSAILGALVVLTPLLALLVFLFNRRMRTRPLSPAAATMQILVVIFALVFLVDVLEKL